MPFILSKSLLIFSTMTLLGKNVQVEPNNKPATTPPKEGGNDIKIK